MSKWWRVEVACCIETENDDKREAINMILDGMPWISEEDIISIEEEDD